MWSCLATMKWKALQRHNTISWQIWRWIGYIVGCYHYDWQNPLPYCARKGHWVVIPGQHTNTLCRPVCQACGSTFWFSGRQYPFLPCSAPAAQHLSNAMANIEPRPFSPWTRLGHDREISASTSKTTVHISWTWSGAARVEQTPSTGHWENHTQHASSTEWMSDKSWRYHPLHLSTSS